MRRLAPILLILSALAGVVGHSVRAAEPPIVVIIHSDGVSRGLSEQTLARIFLRKQSFWQDSVRIQPVNLPVSNPLRRVFSRSVLGALPEDLEDYWRDMYFHGVLPPHVFGSEEAVQIFVATTPGAIGYISNCPTEAAVSVSMIIGDIRGCPH